MVNVIKPKRGDSDPGTDDIADGEIAIRKDVNPPKLFVRVGSSIRELGGGSGDANQTLTTGNGISGANGGSDGNFTIAVEAAQTTVTSMFATDLKIGEDDQTKIDFETENEIQVYLNNAKDFTFSANTFTALSGSSIVVPDGGLTFGSTAISSTAAELNILDGVTSTAAELNILDGVTSTTAELNALDGITAVVGELNMLDLGSTAVGSAVASKVLTYDSNKDITGGRNITISGELDAATLDISGNMDLEGDIDVNGTSNLDNTDIDGTLDVSGIVSIASEMNHTGDTNNSIAFGTDTQTYETGGTTRLDISNSGVRFGATGARITSITDSDSLGTSDTVLCTQGNVKAYVDANAGGISGLGSTDNVILRANGTGGDTAQGSSLVIDDSANLTGANGITGATITATTKLVSDKLEAQNHGGSVMGIEFTDGFGSDDTIEVSVGNAVRFAFVENGDTRAFIPWNDNDVNLGHSSYEFKNLYIDGTAYLDAINFNGTAISATAAELNILDGVTSTATELNLLDGSSANSVVNSKAVVYGSSGELAGTLSTAAQGNVTSLGTLSTLTVDDITINGSTISDGGDFTLDVEGDITVDANGGQIYFKDNGTTYWTFDHGSNDLKLTTGGSNFEIENAGDLMLDAAGDITLDAAGDQIKFADAGSTRFAFNLDSTPEIDVTGNFTIDGSGTITLDGTGGIFMKEGGANTVLIRPTTMNGIGTILKSSNVQYYHASTDSSAFSANANDTGDANTNVRFLPFNTHADHASADEPEHCFQAPCNGHVIAAFATSNNNLVKPFDPGQGLTAWQSHMQILTRDGSGGANIFGGSVDAGDSRVTGTNTSATEVDALGHTNGEYQEAIFPFGGTDIFPLVKGNHYAFVMRYSKMNHTQGAPTPNATTTKNQTLHLTYIIQWDETTSGATLGDWSGY